MLLLFAVLYKIFFEIPCVIIWLLHLLMCYLLSWFVTRPSITENWGMQTGKVAVVVGGATGIGRHLVWKLAKVGCKVLFLDNNTEVADKLLIEVRLAHPDVDVSFVPMDLSKFDSIKEAAKTVIRKYDRINVLYLNAAVPSRSSRLVTVNGNELLSQVNCIGHMAFFEKVKRALIRGKAAIVATGSISHASVVFPNIDDVNYLNEDGMLPYSGWFAYAHSKLIMALYIKKLSEIYAQDGLVFFTSDPKVVITTLGGSFVNHMFHFVNWTKFHDFCHWVNSCIGRGPEKAAEGLVGLGFLAQARSHTGASFSDYQTAVRHWSLHCPHMYNRAYTAVQRILLKNRI